MTNAKVLNKAIKILPQNLVSLSPYRIRMTSLLKLQVSMKSKHIVSTRAPNMIVVMAFTINLNTEEKPKDIGRNATSPRKHDTWYLKLKNHKEYYQ